METGKGLKPRKIRNNFGCFSDIPSNFKFKFTLYMHQLNRGFNPALYTMRVRLYSKMNYYLSSIIN